MTVQTIARALLRRRGSGFIADKPDPEARVWSPLAGGPRLPPDWDEKRGLEAYVPTIYDQGASNSCVAQAFALAIGTLECLLGLPYEPVSRRDLYYRSRFADGIQGDVGSRIATTARVARKWGIAKESDWPFSSIRIDQPTPVSALVEGYERSGLVYEKVTAQGDKLIEALKSATMMGYPVVFGGPLVKRYSDFTGKGTLTPPKAGETITGLHAQTLLRLDVFGRGRVANSWGYGWGDRGLAWWTPGYFVEHCRDFTIIRDWRRARQSHG